MTIARGSTLGPYEIVAHIGAGGMGDVWRARDKRIGRDVAVKVLPDAFAPGDERVRRFEQEARAAGALNHPGLVTIFDVGTLNGSPYIVMELLEGQELREAIGEAPPQPLPLRRTLDYAIQIASALAVAHEKGIIHRDLKPENIFITSDGLVKILDFGLAKLAPESGERASRDRTARHLTSTGMVVGTPGYMSPEQVRAQQLDYRTDIFSLGAVLYEMLSGRRAFDRESAVETMHAVLSDEPPPPSSIDAKVPPALDAIVAHCMEKNPRDRFQSSRDLAFQLRMLLPDSQKSRTDAIAAIKPKRRVPWAVLALIPALLVLGAVGVAVFRGRLGPSFHNVPRTFKQLTFADGVESFPTLAPDGKTFAYVSALSGNRDIYVQRVDGRTATNITSDSPADDSEPAFSPDGSQIAFRSEREGGGIFIMGVTGESVKRLTDEGHNPAWSPNGTRIVYSTAATELRPSVHTENGALWIVDVHSGEKRLLYRSVPNVPSSDALQPSWSPNGKRIAFWGVRSARRDIWTIDPNAPAPASTLVQVTSDPAVYWNPVWSPDGRYLYYGSDADGTLNLWRVAIDEESGKPLGRPELMSLPSPVNGHFSFARDGDMAFVAVTRVYHLLAFPINGAKSEPRTLFGGTKELSSVEPSPDGQSVAFATLGGQEDLFIANADGSRVRQLTNDAAKDRGPTWSPDGKTIYFYSDRQGTYDVWSIHSDGSGLTRISDSAVLHGPTYSPRISPDGQTLVAVTPHTAVLIHLDRPAERRFELLNVLLKGPEWSPDGKRLAANANDGSLIVYSTETRRVDRILDHADFPEWLPDGRHVVFFDKWVMKVVDLDSRRVTDGPTLPAREFATRPFLSKDGSTAYALQMFEQGDVWLTHFRDE